MSTGLASAARPRGFTLVEVLVAMSIMAIVAVMSWQGVDGIVRARNVSESHLNGLLRLNTVMAQFKQDLTQMHDPGASALQPFRYDGARTSIIRRAPGGLQVVVWSLRESAWYRWAGPVVTNVRGLQDSWTVGQRLIGNEAGHLKALPGIEQIQLFCVRDRALVNCQSSAVTQAAPPASAPDQGGGAAQIMIEPPPDVVQVTMSFSPNSGLSGTAVRSFLVKPL